MNGLIRCQNGHLFSSRRYGTVCPYCNMETNTQEKRETGAQDTEDVEELLLMNKIQPVCSQTLYCFFHSGFHDLISPDPLHRIAKLICNSIAFKELLIRNRAYYQFVSSLL